MSRRLALAAVALCLAPGSARTQSAAAGPEFWSGSVDTRHRWLDDAASRNVYRSVVNLGEGVRLFDSDVRYANPLNPNVGEMTLGASGWGGDPASAALFRMSKRDLYELRIDFRNIAYFNNLPSFANPLLAEDVLLSQQAIDMRRRMLDAEFRYRPTAAISPYVAVYRATGRGRGLTTFVSDANEFPVNNNVDDTIWLFRIGTDVRWNWLSLQLEHGHTDYRDRQSIFFDEPGNEGNRRTTFLGEEIVLDSLRQSYRGDGSGFFERAVLQASPHRTVSLSGQFRFSQNQLNSQQHLDASGNFVLQSLLRRFTGQVEQSFGDAKRPRSSGSFGVEFRPTSRLRVSDQWFTDRYHVSSGAPLVQMLNSTPETLIDNLTSQTLNLRYSQNQVDAIFDATSWLSLRGGHRVVWASASVPLDARFARGEPARASNVRRQVGLAGASARAGHFRANADLEASNGTRTFFRTGLLDYEQIRVRGRYDLSPAWSVSAAFRRLDNRNPDPNIQLDFASQQATAALRWTSPAGKRSLLIDYTRSSVRSDIRIVDLPFFGEKLARYRDNSHTGSVFATVTLPNNAEMTLGGTLALTSGSRPTDFYRPRAKLSFPAGGGFHWVSEWNWYGFAEEFFRQEDFRAHTVSTGVNWRF